MNTDQLYEIRLTKTTAIPLEVAQTDFMAKLFKLAHNSNLLGHGLEITRIDKEVSE